MQYVGFAWQYRRPDTARDVDVDATVELRDAHRREHGLEVPYLGWDEDDE